ncbi:MAG: hypothetical protein R3C41_07045 [Calditrichia bacterium]
MERLWVEWFETHADKRHSCLRSLNPNVVYMTTDQGIGASTDRGETILKLTKALRLCKLTILI